MDLIVQSLLMVNINLNIDNNYFIYLCFVTVMVKSLMFTLNVGQTGSGKTHTMFGPPDKDLYDGTKSLEGSKVGLIPRAIHEIFELAINPEVIEFSVLCSFIQLYNEQCYDMLRDSNMSTPLQIREDKKEIYLQGLSEYIVKNVTETMQLLRIAEENRGIS